LTKNQLLAVSKENDLLFIRLLWITPQ
jgi:hypothetical protein